MWQGIIVALIVAAAGFYVFRRFKRTLTPPAESGGGCGCGCSGGCSADSQESCPSKDLDLPLYEGPIRKN
jgi:hypothetical protein